MVKKAKPAIAEVPAEIKLNLGAGKSKVEGFTGVDIIPGADLQLDLRVTPWPWADGSVSEAFSSHFLEHLSGEERIPFFNELYRVMKVGAQARFVCPIWSHERAYGDPTHKWPPVSTWTFYYLGKAWREINASHVGYVCDFDWVIVGTMDPNDSYVALRNQETRTILMSRQVNTTVDIVATLTKKA